MEFIVAGYPSFEEASKEFLLIKIGVLYADTIRLISPYVDLYDAFSFDFSGRNRVRKIPGFVKKCRTLAQQLDNHSLVRECDYLMNLLGSINLSQYNSIPYAKRYNIEKELETAVSAMTDQLNTVFDQNQMKAVTLLKKKRILQTDRLDHVLEFKEDSLAIEYIHKLLKGSGEAFPLYDERVGSLVNEIKKALSIDWKEIERKNFGFTGLSKLWSTNLPTFENATIDEILDLREEFKDQIVRFRSAVLRYSEEIQSLPWDDDFQVEADRLFEKEVSPRLVDLRADISDNKIMKNLFGAFHNNIDYKKLTGSLALGTFCRIPGLELNSLMTILISGAPIAIASLVEGFQDYFKKNKELRNNDLFFYHVLAEKYD